MLSCVGEREGVAVSGYVSSPSAGRGNRAMQFFFCNGRAIRSQLLQAALEQAYKNTLLTGRFPACVLYLTLPYGSVDVNVHPAKTEVKFTDERKVFDAVYYAVLSALAGEERAKAPSAELPDSIRPREGFYQSMSAEDFRAKYEREIESAIRDIKPATGGLRWMFSSSDKKERAQSAYEARE